MVSGRRLQQIINIITTTIKIPSRDGFSFSSATGTRFPWSPTLQSLSTRGNAMERRTITLINDMVVGLEFSLLIA
jgi:hypothetical protein